MLPPARDAAISSQASRVADVFSKNSEMVSSRAYSTGNVEFPYQGMKANNKDGFKWKPLLKAPAKGYSVHNDLVSRDDYKRKEKLEVQDGNKCWSVI